MVEKLRKMLVKQGELIKTSAVYPGSSSNISVDSSEGRELSHQVTSLPAEQEIEVITQSERLMKYRRMINELLSQNATTSVPYAFRTDIAI
jgi:hypothetical protein